MRASLLLLADSRLPAGGHAHSGGVEAAIRAGWVTDLDDLERFLRGRLATVGISVAATAACACTLARQQADLDQWLRLDAEVGARTPSASQRATSRAQGRALLRLVRVGWPAPALDLLGSDPYHPVVLGVAVAGAGGLAVDAARIAALASVTGPASAALRLLGLDPAAVSALTVLLADAVDRIAVSPVRAPGDLPAPGAPALDVLAEVHAQERVRMFAS